MASKTKKIVRAARQWQVRDENGGIFGPVDFSALKSWVEDGRVSPLSEVSSDGGRWVPATQVRELEMNCVAEIEPGSFYGPIHRKAMRGLIETGSISADASVYGKDLATEQEEQSQSIEGVPQAEYDAALEQLAELAAQKSGVEAQLQSARLELADLTVLCQSEKKRGGELSGTVAMLQHEVDRLRGEGDDDQALIQSLQSQCEDYEASINSLKHDSLKEHVKHGEEVDAKNLEISGLLLQLEELKLANRGLQEEFIKYEELQSGSGSGDADRRKLVLMKKLFAEAAVLLEEIGSLPEEVPEDARDVRPVELAEAELLDYEEVSHEEFQVRKGAPVASAEPVKEKISRSGSVKNQKTSKMKVAKKWPFGSSKKNLGHDSLAELEAQAQIELQRLASSQDVSALFDRKK